MASIIKLKRSATAGAQPGSLEVGEIAVNLFDRKLYVGNSTGVSAIGGEDFRLTVDEGSVAGDGAYIKLLGETSESTNSIFLQAGAGMDVTKQANGSITFGIENASTTNVGGASFNSNNFVVDSNGLASIAPSGITLGGETSGNYVATVAASNNSLVVTGSGSETAGVTVALGDNIGANTTGNARTATTWETQRNIGVRLAGDISGYANTNIDGSGNVLIDVNTAIQPNSIALGTDTTGNYVATVAAGNNSVLVTGSGSETAGITVALADNIGANTTGNARTATTLATARNIALSGDIVGNANFDGSGDITISTAIQPNSIALGTDTTGNYLATLAASNNSLVVTGSGSESATVSVAIADNIGANTSGNAATASKLATARAIALTGDVVGTVNFDGSSGVSMTTAIQPNSIALGTDTTGNFMRDVSGTANEIVVTHTPGEASTATIGLPDDVTVAGQLNVGENIVVTGNTVVGALTVTGDAHVDGNLTVEGAVTYISSSTVNVDDSMLKLSANNAADTVDTGVYGKYVVSGNSAVQYTGYFRDATTGHFNFYTGLDVEPTTTVDITDTGYTLAQLNAIIDGGTY